MQQHCTFTPIILYDLINERTEKHHYVVVTIVTIARVHLCPFSFTQGSLALCQRLRFKFGWSEIQL